MWKFVYKIAAYGYPVPSTLQPEILAYKLFPQHHEIDFGLTHKANFSYTPYPKSEFLSWKYRKKAEKQQPCR
jgi:hypothetical protein